MNLDPNYHVSQIEKAAQSILDVRSRHKGRTLAWLYNPETMPNELRAAHAANDKAVDNMYIAAELAAGRKRPNFSTEEKRVAFLFELYQRRTVAELVAKEQVERHYQRELL